MSFNIRNIREISNDPLTKFTNQLSKKLGKFLIGQETDKLENKEDIYSDGQDVDVALKFNSLNFTSYFDGSKQYFPTYEPDGIFNTCWIKGINIGSTTRDLSQFQNIATINGDPILMDGTPLDLGIALAGVKSTCVRYNRPTSSVENEEYMNIPDAVNMQVSGIATGISYFMRFRIKDLDTQGGLERTLFEKIDDSTPNNAVIVTVSTDGRIKCYVKRSGTWYRNQTTTGAVVPDTVHDVFITYAVSGNTVHIYVDSSDKSLTDPGSDPTLHTTLTNHDTSIFRRGLGTSGGYTYGDFYDFMVYREKVISSTEVQSHFSNKWTIAAIPFGAVMITNYWATYDETQEACSFSQISFSPTSFTVCIVPPAILSFTSGSFTSGSFTL